MAADRKKIVAFLVVAASCSSMLMICAAQSPSAKPAEPLFSSSSSLFANDPNFPVKPVNNNSSRELFFKMMVSVLLVVVLGAAAIYISKRFLPKITRLTGKEIRIIETVHIGPRKAVHLLKIGKRRLLIGSTNESITKLADVTDEALFEVDLSTTEANNN